MVDMEIKENPHCTTGECSHLLLNAEVGSNEINVLTVSTVLKYIF